MSSRTLLSGSLVLSLDFFSGEFDGTIVSRFAPNSPVECCSFTRNYFAFACFALDEGRGVGFSVRVDHLRSPMTFVAHRDDRLSVTMIGIVCSDGPHGPHLKAINPAK